MSFQLREAILQHVSNHTPEQLEATIQDAVESGEEKMLPGLGVLFEVFWQHANDSDKDKVGQEISSGLQT